MAIVKSINLRCDLCEYLSRTFTGTNAEAKQALRAEGWRFRGGVHKCPACVVNATSQQTPDAEETDEGAGEE